MNIATQELKFGEIKDAIIKAFPDYGEMLAKEFDDDADFIRKSDAAEVIEVQDATRVIIGRISSHSIDRDGDVVLPQGMDDSDYRKNAVVLFSHDYGGGLFSGTTYELPHARNQWLKQYPGKKPVEIRAATEYAPKEINEFGEKIFQYRKAKWPLGYSIGFIPIKTLRDRDEDEWKDTLLAWKRRLAAETGEDIAGIPEPKRFYVKWKLLEYSDVKIPANQDAVQLMISKGMMEETERESYTIKEPEIKSVIPYHDYGKAPEGDSWDGPAEIAKSDTATLKKICTWYDSENPDVKSSYKLPHHHSEGLKAVWNGVSSAMGALLGARGGVDIPASDRRGVYNHLKRHYQAFDKEPPEFRELDDIAIITASIDDITRIDKELGQLRKRLSELEAQRYIEEDEEIEKVLTPEAIARAFGQKEKGDILDLFAESRRSVFGK